eukprot:TRINITY_DN2674_c0_g1_i1.p1 TRINITY_DN2674_c0_g1~~TRINITY_DN2674_c0_g1_i1.p1  ORF type:complete len:181 (+),score=33.44 TRINITY_DN2674_c0_g1_i1:69-611(+)
MTITPKDVLKHSSPSSAYLCPLSANTYGIEFLEFRIRDMESDRVLFQVKRDKEAEAAAGIQMDDDSVRFIRYDFGSDFFNYKTLGASLVFAVGPKEVPNFRMVERHYFRNKLIKSFDFKFGYCIPNSSNSWEVIYDIPPLSKKEAQEMIENPYETKSDSFYFVEDKLIMHNKAEYSYSSR